MLDVAVVGLGVMGSAAAWQLARRGLRVAGVEQFTPAHDRGSSHGLTRVIRKAYYEHPHYVPLVLRAYELWAELERETGHEFLRRTGGFMIGTPECRLVRGSLESARTHRLEHCLLDTRQLRDRFPFMTFREGEVGLEEFDAGVLLAEDAVLTFQELARRAGAELRFGTRDVPQARKTVLAAGPWMPQFVPALPLKVERQVLYWFDPRSDRERPPLFMWERDGRMVYSIPDVRDHGVKVAVHHAGEITTAESVRRDVRPAEVEDIRAWLAAAIPSLNGTPRKISTCLYTNTPDDHFVIGPLSDRPDVILASPCSGHGFKFAPVVGEVLADLVTEGRTRHPLDPFRPARFGA